jgi:hypothetical protein
LCGVQYMRLLTQASGGRLPAPLFQQSVYITVIKLLSNLLVNWIGGQSNFLLFGLSKQSLLHTNATVCYLILKTSGIGVPKWTIVTETEQSARLSNLKLSYNGNWYAAQLGHCRVDTGWYFPGKLYRVGQQLYRA